MIRLLLALALAAAAAFLPGGTAGHAQTMVGRVTYYEDSGWTYGETWTTAGRTAACGWGIPLWSWVTLPDGTVRLCEDRIGKPKYAGDVDVYDDPDLPAAVAPYCWGPAQNECYVEVGA